MAQSRAFAILGDSNVRNHVTKTSCRSNPQLKDAQILSCGHLGIFAETLVQVAGDSTICIVSCLTNFLTSATGPPSVSNRIEPVLQEIHGILVDSSSNHPDRWYLVSPPMYRTNPTWYRDGLPEILTLFSQIFNGDQPENLRLLPSFPTPAFETDGVHLTAFSGLELVHHLIDASQDLLEMMASDQASLNGRLIASARVLEDRVMVLEQVFKAA